MSNVQKMHRHRTRGQSLGEAQIIQRARNGDRAAARALYETHVDRVFRLAFRMTGDEDQARDATQDAFVRAFQRLDQFRGDAAFGTWLHTIAVSVVMNEVRKRNGRTRREVEIDPEFHADSAMSRGDSALRTRIREAVDELPEIYRTVFVMYDMEGFSHAEIGESLGVAEGTSKARLSRARERLRAGLANAWEEWKSNGAEHA